jgi:hypothetical protein
MSAVLSPPTDVDGSDLRPDLSLARTPADLVTALRLYRIWAGEPPFRQMADRAGRAIAPSTMCTALNAPPGHCPRDRRWLRRQRRRSKGIRVRVAAHQGRYLWHRARCAAAAGRPVPGRIAA